MTIIRFSIQSLISTAIEFVHAVFRSKDSPLRAAALCIIGAGGNRALQIASLLIVAQKFDGSALSTVSSIVLWSAILGLSVAPGFSLPLTGAIIGAQARNESSILPALFLLMSAAIITLILSLLIVISSDVAPSTIGKYRFGIFFSTLSIGICVQTVVFAGFLSERRYCHAMFSNIATGAVQFLSALTSPNVDVILKSMTFGTLAMAIIFGMSLLNHLYKVGLERTGKFSGWRITISRITPSLVGSSVVEPTNLFVLTYIFNNEKYFLQTAVVTVAQQWVSLLVFIPMILSQLALPNLMRLAENCQYVSFRKQSVKLVTLNFILIALPFVSLIAVSSILLSFYDLDRSWHIFVILLIAGWIAAISSPFGTILNGLGYFRYNAFGNVLWCSIFIGAAFALQNFATEGFAVARALAYSVYLFFMLLSTIWWTRKLS